MNRIACITVIAIFAGFVLAQVPPNSATDGAGTYITWDGFASSSSAQLQDVWVVGAPVMKIAHTIDNGSVTPMYALDATDTVAWLRHGFRSIDFDVRKPFSWVDSLDTISYAPQWLVSWMGVDTTYEDGEGWGLWKYTVQYAKDSPDSTWHDWFTLVDFTEAMFGPSSPAVVEDSARYYFRIVVEDLNTNREDEHYYDQCVQYIQPNLSFSVKNLASGIDWTARETLAIAEDSIALPTAQDVFIVRNLSILDSIGMALRSYPVAIPMDMGWHLDDHPDTNKFALRAIFNDIGTPPTHAEFDSPNNIVRDTFITATSEILGTGGYRIRPVWSDSLSRTENLWLQFQLPTWSYAYGETTNVQMILQLKAIPLTP